MLTASNAIEGVLVDSARAERIADAGPRLRNRNEKEFAGYRDAIDLLMRAGDQEPLTVPLLLHLHRLLFHHSGGRGGSLVFEPPGPEETEFLLTELLARYEEAKRTGETHPLVLICALILDLLAIHPVADGNGRLARLTTTHEMLACGYGVARYVSVEQRIYKSRNSYYAALYESQRGWRERREQAGPSPGLHPQRGATYLLPTPARARVARDQPSDDPPRPQRAPRRRSDQGRRPGARREVATPELVRDLPASTPAGYRGVCEPRWPLTSAAQRARKPRTRRRPAT